MSKARKRPDKHRRRKLPRYYIARSLDELPAEDIRRGKFELVFFERTADLLPNPWLDLK